MVKSISANKKRIIKKNYNKNNRKKSLKHSWTSKSFEKIKIIIGKNKNGTMFARSKKSVGILLKQCHNNEISNDLTCIAKFAKKFFAHIAEGPIYPCVVCLRQLFKKQVTVFNKMKYKNHPNINEILLNETSTLSVSKNWICHLCKKSLTKNRVPAQANINGLQLTEVPQELEDLTPLEERIISLRIPFMKMVALPAGGQKCIHGHAINVPAKLDAITSVLPRIPENCQVIPLKLKKKLSYDGHYQHSYIRPQKVNDALCWLKYNNALYKNIDVLIQWEEQWQCNDPELWQSLICDEPNVLHNSPEIASQNLNSLHSNTYSNDLSFQNDCSSKNSLPNRVELTSSSCSHLVHQSFNDEACYPKRSNLDNIECTQQNTSAIHPSVGQSKKNSNNLGFPINSEFGNKQNSKQLTTRPCPFANKHHVGDNELYQQLKNQANNLYLRLHNVPGDGNCFFHSVSLACHDLGLDVGSAETLRKMVIDYLENQSLDMEWKKDYLVLEDDEPILRSYLDHANYLRSSNYRSFATEWCPPILSRLLKIKLTIHHADTNDRTGKPRVLSRNQNELGPFILENVVHIGLISQVHFVAMLQLSHLCFHTNAMSSENLSISFDASPNSIYQSIPMHMQSAYEQDNQRNTLSPKENSLELENSGTDCMNDHTIHRNYSKKSSLLFDTCLQPESNIDTSIYCIAPAENQTPIPFLSDPLYEEMANPTKYPTGTGGYSSERNAKLTLKRYLNQRILHMDGRFAKDLDYIFAAQYATEAKQVNDDMNIFLRQTKSVTSGNQAITAGIAKNNLLLQKLIRDDSAFRYMKNIRGSPAYWKRVLNDLLAMVRQLGIPTWFLTLSAADMQWPEVIKSIALGCGEALSDEDVVNMSASKKADWLRKNPVCAARMFQNRLDAFFKMILLGPAKPIGNISDFMIRIEFQSRGSPHAHCILWVKDAPTLEKDSDKKVIDFIDTYQTCSLPTDSEMNSLVKKLQKHVCTESCQRKEKSASGKVNETCCRFHFPHPPSDQTMIARQTDDKSDLINKKKIKSSILQVLKDEGSENITLEEMLYKACIDKNEYKKHLQMTKRGMAIVLKRQPCESNINFYNSDLLKIWQANMDLQFIIDPYACVMYITSYMMKSEGTMSELLSHVATECEESDLRSRMKKVGATFLNKREVSAQEACFRLVPLYLKKASRSVVFANTTPPENRTSMLKSKAAIAQLPDDSEDITCTSLLDRYIARPDIIEDISYVEFAATYATQYENSSEDSEMDINLENATNRQEGTCIEKWPAKISLKHGLGYMKRRKQHIVVRFYKVKKDDIEKYCRNMIMLFYPFRDEFRDLCDENGSFFGKYSMVKNDIHRIESLFSKNSQEFDSACEDIINNGPLDDAWHCIGPNAAFLEAEQEQEGFVLERCVPEENYNRNVDIEDFNKEGYQLKDLFTKETDKALLTTEEYNNMVSSLNEKQKAFMEFHRQWARKAFDALRQGLHIPQYTVFLSGPGGVGKSHIIKLIKHETYILKQISGVFDVTDIPILLTAFTGTAAFAIDGMTLHSALGFTTTTKEYTPLTSNKLNTLQSFLSKLLVLIIDEISMVGSDFLHHVHRRLVEIKGCEDPFGGVSILCVGDLYQLPPVGQHQVFHDPTDPFAKLAGSLWKSHFKIYELTESMRQRGDMEFSEILGRVRTGECTEKDFITLKSRNVQDTINLNKILHVFSTNKAVDTHNKNMLKKNVPIIFTFKSEDSRRDAQTGQVKVSFSKSKTSETGGLRELVEIGIGARVMLSVNIDVSDGLVNGVCGTVVGFDGNTSSEIRTIFVNFDSPRVGKKNITKSFNSSHPNAVSIHKKEVHFCIQRLHGIRRQFPLTLAWACTIHKVQGQTLDNIVVSMEKSTFMAGQAYVAFSRVKTLKGLHLVGFNQKYIKANKDAKDEMKRICDYQTLEIHPNLFE